MWPFKLGLYAFIYAISGIDISWILSWFDIFPFFKFNIPQWVYIQYLSLYSNWIDWWKGTVKIKNLNVESIPSIPKSDTELTEGNNNKWFNKKKYYYCS